MLIEENKPLAPFTTFGIGGPARWFVEAASEEEIAEAAAWARERGVPLFVLGGGSNLLVSDAGFDGLVLRVGLRGIDVRRSERGQRIYQVAAGEDWDHFVERTVEDNCAGLECLAGIPGTVGGTPVQNVGAYGQEVASAIERVRAFDLRERSLCRVCGRRVRLCLSPQPLQLGRSRALSCDPRGLPAHPRRRADAALRGAAKGACGAPGGGQASRALPKWPPLCAASASPRECCWSRAIPIAAARAASSRIPWSSEEQLQQIAAAGAQGAAALSRRTGRGESRQGQDSRRLADRAGRLRQRLRAGRRRHLLAAHAGAHQSRRSGSGRYSGARRANHRRGRRSLWNSSGNGTGDGGVLSTGRFPGSAQSSTPLHKVQAARSFSPFDGSSVDFLFLRQEGVHGLRQQPRRHRCFDPIVGRPLLPGHMPGAERLSMMGSMEA